MKKKDFLVILIVVLFFAPFFIFHPLYNAYLNVNRSNPYLMAFVKFALLSTFGEMLAMRIKTGEYYNKNFGVAAKAIVWGFLGMWIALAMNVFSSGVPIIVDRLIGGHDITNAMQGNFTIMKLVGAFCISVMMNTSVAPVFMTLHKLFDIHIANNNGQLKCLAKPMRCAEGLSKINWDVQWNFVFKKTVPLFWIPAHTLTFCLPKDFQVLFAALLGIALGLILAIASIMGNKK